MITPAVASAMGNTLRTASHVVLLTHGKPDGDAVGSTLGLALALENEGKRVSVVCRDPIPVHYRFLPGSDQFIRQIPDNYDALVLLDCGSDHVTGFELPPVPNLLEIDHHPKYGETTPRLLAHDTDASSTGEMVYELLTAWRWHITRGIATCLLTGIITDTSAFQNNNTTARTLRVAAELLRLGANRKEIVRQCFYTSTIPKLKLWGTAMARIEQTPQASGIVSTVITAEDLLECGAHPDDIEGLVNFLNAIPGVPALLLLTDLDQGQVKGSFRTRNEKIDVARLARLFGGGGHPLAAGFSIPGSLLRRSDETWEIQPPALTSKE